MDEGLQTPEGDESAHTTGRRSARGQQVEIITRGERRRSWTPEQKREIVAESLGPELTPTEVARRHAISTGQLYTWRRELLSMPCAVTERAMPRLAEVELAPAPPGTSAPTPADGHAPPGRLAPVRPAGMIEIVLPGGVSLRVDARVDGPALRRVLDALDRR
jgi:transposase